MATDPNDNSPPTVVERYSVAAGTSNMLLSGGMVPEGLGSADADMVLAAGFTRGLGVSLLRLRQEWDTSSKPRRPGPQLMQALVGYVKRDDLDQRQRAEQHGQAWAAPKTSPAVRAAELADAWFSEELQLLLGNLPTRRAVLVELHAWAAKQGIGPEHVGAAVLLWLDPRCHKCHGHGKLKAPDQPLLSAKLCHQCQGTGNAYRHPPVARVIGYMDYCEGVAKGGIARASSRA